MGPRWGAWGLSASLVVLKTSAFAVLVLRGGCYGAGVWNWAEPSQRPIKDEAGGNRQSGKAQELNSSARETMRMPDVDSLSASWTSEILRAGRSVKSYLHSEL